jgi:myo-inositol 2-dehydrogenase/D-chiro-inositol 1-dehydrogenase
MNVGIVGAGNIAETAHLPALKSIPSIHIAGIADLNATRVKKIARKFQIEHWYTDYMELMNDSSIEIIHVCTPPQVRLEIIKSAAVKGKHVFVEKPLALSVKEAIEILRITKEHKIMVTVVQNYRRFSSAIKARQRISGGYLGNVITMQGTGLTPHPANQSKALHYYHPSGVLFDFAPHLIDMILWFSGSVVEQVFAYGGDFTNNMGFVNYAQILLKFQNKSVAVADVSWLTGIEGMRFTVNVHGTGGHILLDVRNDSYTEFHGVLTPIDDVTKSVSKAIGMSKGALTGNYFTAPFLHYRDLILDFVDAIQKKTQPSVTIEQALMTTAVLDAAKESIDKNNPVNLKDLFQSPNEFDSISHSLNEEPQ